MLTGFRNLSALRDSKGYQVVEKQDVTISALAANVYGTLFGLTPAAILLLIFYFVWQGRPVVGPPEGFSLLHTLLLGVVGIVVHELLHGLGWRYFAGVPWEQIHFGVQWKVLTPYAHSSARMPLRPYRRAILLPGLLLGLIPALLGVFNGSVLLLGFGAFFTATAGGDFLILWMLRRVPAGAHVQDHPTLVGATVYY